jgi:hypothetical protein
MTYRITNNAKGPRGIWSQGRLVWLEPGASKTFEPDDIARVRRTNFLTIEGAGSDLPPVPKDLAARFDNDGDGKPGGSKKQPATDDIKALRAEYEKKLGKKPFNGWPAETLREKIGAA